jgi:uncharacterized protein
METQSQELQMARQSLIEELQAIDYYQGRIDTTEDEGLKKILIHNRDEEKEHVAMLMEWIRANDAVQDKMFSEHD